MSEANDRPAQPPKKSSALLRTLILLGLLIVIVAGGLWDWYGAKEPRNQAYDRVLALQGSATGMSDLGQAATTQAEVQKAVGTNPSESTTEDGVIYERYSWRRGIPWMTYDLWVLYRSGDDKEMLVAQLGEEGKPDPIYAANSRSGKAPEKGTTAVDGDSTDSSAEGAAGDETPDATSEGPDDSTTGVEETPAEAPEEGSTPGSSEEPGSSTPTEPAAGEASSEAPATEEPSDADPAP